MATTMRVRDSLRVFRKVKIVLEKARGWDNFEGAVQSEAPSPTLDPGAISGVLLLCLVVSRLIFRSFVGIGTVCLLRNEGVCWEIHIFTKD